MYNIQVCICNPSTICIEFCNHAIHQHLKSGKQNKILTFGSGTPTTQSKALMFVRNIRGTWESHSTSLNSTFLIWKVNLIKLVYLLFLVNYYQSISDKYAGIISYAVNTDVTLYLSDIFLHLMLLSLRNNQSQFCYTLEYSAVILMILTHFS